MVDKETNVAGGNKGHSPKTKKRQLQEQAKATRDAAEKAADKRKRWTDSSRGPSRFTPESQVSQPEMTRSQLEAHSENRRPRSS